MTVLLLSDFACGPAVVRPAREPGPVLLFLHGAGLEPTHELYRSFAESCPKNTTVILPFFSASHFVSFEKSFRDVGGWAAHCPEQARSETAAWVSVISKDNEKVILGGHSWGANLAAHSATNEPLFLASPINRIRSIIDHNVGVDTNLHDLSTNGPDWIECQPNAPFPFLSRQLIHRLQAFAEEPLAQRLDRHKADIAVTFGTREHQQAYAWREELDWEQERLTWHWLERVGHFYGGRGEALAGFFRSWMGSAF